MPSDITEFVKGLGYAGLCAAVFAESGMLVGFFLPGDSLLFTAGILSAAGIFNIWILCPFLIAAAVLGDAIGFRLGRSAGAAILDRPDSFFLRRSHVERTRDFFKQ